MKKTIVMIIALLCTSPFGGWGAGAWAQDPTPVSKEGDLRTAVQTNGANIQLTADIQLENYLNINGKTVTIDLNGHTLSRSIAEYNSGGHVIYAHGGSTLTLTSSNGYGYIEGGMANNGGAINIPHGNTVSATNITFRNNSALKHAGAVWNNGTFTAENCTFTGNSCTDVGAVYNAVQTDDNGTYAGTATLTNCTITGNWGTTGAGALANALGDTEMTIDGCTIENNTSGSRGAGIWNGGKLNMKGAITVQNNTDDGGVVSNVFLKNKKVITVIGALTGSQIGIDLESLTGTFTSGYNSHNSGVAPNTIFTVDRSSILALEQDGGEARLVTFNPNPLSYIERSWDDTNKKVVITEKALKRQINDEDTPAEGDYKEVTSAPTDNPEQWLGIGGYSTTVPEYYVVQGDVNRETIVVQGTNVHLILCDGATLTLTGGLKLEGDNKLYIHCQSYGGSMGRLMVTNKNSSAAGIGSAHHEGKNRVAGELVIYGGHIEATGGSYAAGIGSCSRAEWNSVALCKNVTVYGGYVMAKGGSGGAGIGGGSYFYYDTPVYIGVDGGQLIIYDGTVIAQGGNHAAGVGGGEYGKGGTVTVYGGSLTATGKEYGAGIGGGSFKNDSKTGDLTGGKLTVYGGMVTATSGGDYAAGIGGGNNGGGAEVNIEGGTVTATGGGAGIGGGYWGRGGNVTITGGTVIAKAGTQGDDGYRAIGPGRSSNNYGALTIGNQMMVGAGNNGSVESIFDAADRKNGCWYRSYAEVSPCTHPAGLIYTINNDGTHTSHCKHCAVTETTGHSIGICVCGYDDSGSLAISLADNGDNGEKLTTYNGRTAASVTLTGRTLYKDGYWNTLCLPFDVASFTGTPLAGATVMELGNINCNTGFDANTGTLTLDFVPANKIEAGHAYIVRWGTPETPVGGVIENPVFNGVTIVNESPADQAATSKDGYVTFIGSYSPMTFTAADKSVLFLGSNDKLYYPSKAMTINACRAYFQLNNGLTASPNPSEGGGTSVRAFVLNFGEEDPTGITDAEANSSFFILHSSFSEWYTLDGRKLSCRPSRAGMYLYNGKKVVIK